ncbi:uncharacterized protein LOC104896854 [Beta vulgaris subsp. vulgaris]|uniref:uncharacterized protein LOC104896854 n=1 Tax=Beta vulgaris subsp. vulgaris TaxID=3555 RepID=UPI002036AA6E|nr:uncharacterized protein LOC104896854 [Beta vulgaris subsp. vulgaris]
MANNNNNLAATIRLLVEKLTQERAERPNSAGDMFETLAKVKPPYYKGQADTTFLENWIREFEKIFRTVKCPEGIRVGQDVLYLNDEVDLWWRENGARLSVVEGFTWDAFVIATFMRKQKVQEFINLMMGSMTISEYYNKFIALSRFAPKVVATEELKSQRFEQRLTDEIQLALGEFNLGDLDVIRGMNWLCFYKANIDSKVQKVVLRNPLGKLTFYKHFGKPKNFRVISAMQVRKLMKKGCELFFYSVQDVSKEVGVNIEDVPILNEFMDVFSSEILGMPPPTAVEFTID